MGKNLLSSEIKFAWHLGKINDEDYHYVKEVYYYDDSSKEAKTYLVKDFKRPIWVTKKQFRKYKQKKEFEDFDKLHKVYCTESDLNRVAAGLIEQPYNANNTDAVKSSPYVYGYDITSTSLIKYSSLRKNNFISKPYSVAACDIEIDPDTQEIILISAVYENRVYTAILKKFVSRVANLEMRLRKAYSEVLKDHSDKVLEFGVFDDEIELLTKYFEVVNKWAPDFLAIWNMNFDIPHILSRIKYHRVDPRDVICDKSIPYNFRVCKYKQGITKKVTASGVVKPINPSLQWHTLVATTSFYVIDPMCVYRQLRISKQEEPSYALDAILAKEKIPSKLKFDVASQYSGLKWHLFMQQNYPIEYILYNIYDCIAILELDKKTKDLTQSLPAFSSITDFAKFNSNPKKIVDALFLFGLQRQKVVGTAWVDKSKSSSSFKDIEEYFEDEEDEDEDSTDISKYKTLDLKGWIQLLPQNLLLKEGLTNVKDYPDLVTNIRGLVVDLDASSAYPSATLVANVSKETCYNELIKINDVDEKTFREQNLSICLGPTNMLEYFNKMFNMPSLIEIKRYLDEMPE